MIPFLISSKDAVDGKSAGRGGDRGRISSFDLLSLKLSVTLATRIGCVVDGLLIGDGRSTASFVIICEDLVLAR